MFYNDYRVLTVRARPAPAPARPGPAGGSPMAVGLWRSAYGFIWLRSVAESKPCILELSLVGASATRCCRKGSKPNVGVTWQAPLGPIGVDTLLLIPPTLPACLATLPAAAAAAFSALVGRCDEDEEGGLKEDGPSRRSLSISFAN